MVEYDADEGICLDKEARREDTEEVVEDCLAAKGLDVVDVEESRAE
jgi:nicotinamide riboside kinase